MKETQQSLLARRRAGGKRRLSTVPLPGGGRTMLRSGGSSPSPRKGSDMVLLLRSHGTGQDPRGSSLIWGLDLY
jgi:hypothetical protein